MEHIYSILTTVDEHKTRIPDNDYKKIVEGLNEIKKKLEEEKELECMECSDIDSNGLVKLNCGHNICMDCYLEHIKKRMFG